MITENCPRCGSRFASDTWDVFKYECGTVVVNRHMPKPMLLDTKKCRKIYSAQLVAAGTELAQIVDRDYPNTEFTKNWRELIQKILL